jgi:hypothetical protein
MNDLFCTPYQGHKLTELISDLSYKYAWLLSGWESGWVDYPLPLKGLSSMYPNTLHAAALTLQELRDVAIEHGMDISDLEDHLYSSTAPKLADWVIARLE